MNRRNSFFSASLCVIALSGFTMATAQVDKSVENKEKSTIVVSGRADIKVQPDIAHVNVGVIANATTAAQALEDNSTLMNNLLGVLKAQGIEGKDIRTSNLSVQPQYSQPQPGFRGEFVPKIVGYNVTNTVAVTVRKMDKLGAMLDLLIQNGANQLHGISFEVDQAEKHLDAARSAAVTDARNRANLYCEKEAVKPGRILHIQESSATMPVPQPFMGGMMRAMAADRMTPPIAGGETELNVRVQVVFELVPTTP